MDAVSLKPGRLRMPFAAGACLLAGLLSGCVATEHLRTTLRPHHPPLLSQVHGAWKDQLVVTQDTVNAGKPLAGIAGRVYLFGPDLGFPQKGEGTLVVDLYDATNIPAGEKPKMLERWKFDPTSLDRLCRKDTIGWGYTVFLPWSTYRPDILQVQMRVAFHPKEGNVLYGPPAMIHLRRDEESATVENRQVLPQAPRQTPPPAHAARPPIPLGNRTVR